MTDWKPIVEPTTGHGPDVGDAFVQARSLTVHFAPRRGLLDRVLRVRASALKAVHDVDLDIRAGEIVALVGESGSGKTTLGRALVRLVHITSGTVRIGETDVADLGGSALRSLRRDVQMISQSPHGSLSPRQTVGQLLSEPYIVHDVPRSEQSTVAELLELVELSPAMASKYPHQLSGGQARRVGIARALALRPRFLVADEPTSGLDVSATAKILLLLKRLRDEHGLTILLITHNLNIVEYIADRIAVMYLGRMIEVGDAADVLTDPHHPYTIALLDSISEPDPTVRRGRRRMLLPGEIPSPLDPPPGCTFHTRCPHADKGRCRTVFPPLLHVGDDQSAACHYATEVATWRRARLVDDVAPTEAAP